jgi:catechol 2,3-dioxygenase-like lactoylglutathione lyase family enzyme
LGGIYDRRSKLDITFKSAPLESPDDPVLVAYCHDPDGVIIELVELLGVQR